MISTVQPFPHYKCHKIVRAKQITDTMSVEGGKTLFFDGDNQTITLTFDEIKGKPFPVTGMYMVFYEDGHFSFSPAKAFEEGYAPFEPYSE